MFVIILNDPELNERESTYEMMISYIEMVSVVHMAQILQISYRMYK